MSTLALCALIAQLPPPAETAPLIDHEVEAARLVRELAEGHPELVAHRFDARLRALMSDAKLAAVWSNLERSLGSFVRVEKSSHQKSGNFESVEITCRMKQAGLDVQLVFDEAGRISGLFFEPNEDVVPIEGWTPPSYADGDRIVEERLPIVDDTGGDLILTRPRHASTTLPLVVLAPSPERPNRDADDGARRPHKDFAFGLASLGLAVVRYDGASSSATLRLASVLRTMRSHVVVDAERVALAVRSEAQLPTEPTLASDLAAVIWTKGTMATDRAALEAAAQRWPVLAFDIAAPVDRPKARVARLQLETYPALDPWLTKSGQTHVHPEVVEDIASFMFRLPAKTR